MSKTKLIELIKASNFELKFWLEQTPIEEIRKTFRIALKEQHNDTCQGCALKIHTDMPDEHHPILNLAQCSCLNCQDKDLERL